MQRSPLQSALGKLAVSPNAAFRHTLKKRLLQRSREIGFSPSPLSPFAWALRFGSVAFGIAVIVSGAYAYESPSVTRTSPLYLVKRVGESVELAVANQQGELVDVYLKIATRRLAESETLAVRGIVDGPTIAEVKTNTEQALAAAKTLDSGAMRGAARQKVARASSRNADSLRSVSITAQVATKKSVISVQNDLVAIAPPPSSLPATSTGVDPASPEDGVAASLPREGSVAGSSLSVAPSKTDLVTLPATVQDPSIGVLDDAIDASTKIAADASVKEPGLEG